MEPHRSPTSSASQTPSSKITPSDIHPQLLTDSQAQILKTFRAELEDEGHLKPGETLGTDDATLIRFLRARRFNLNLAKRMITQCLQWRHQFEGIGIDGLYRELDPFNFPQRDEVFKYWPMYYHRVDKLGRPVNIQVFGALDLAKLYTVIDKQAHFRTVVANCEALTREILPACTHRKQHLQSSVLPPGSPKTSLPAKITNAFCIVDLKGFTVSQFWQIKSVARTCFGISQDYYPETMGYLAIINAPKSFATIFRAIQPWLSKETIAKINILGDDYQSTLLEHIDPENLPSFLGGTCECEEERPWSCAKNDEGFEYSPWLKDRDWKQESWRRFRGENGPGERGGSVYTRTSETQSGHGDENEVTDGGVTQDGALIINTTKKDGLTSPGRVIRQAFSDHATVS